MGVRGRLLTVGADLGLGVSDCPRVISAGELVLGLVEVTRRTPVLPGETGPEDPIETVVIDKPSSCNPRCATRVSPAGAGCPR